MYRQQPFENGFSKNFPSFKFALIDFSATIRHVKANRPTCRKLIRCIFFSVRFHCSSRWLSSLPQLAFGPSYLEDGAVPVRAEISVFLLSARSLKNFHETENPKKTQKRQKIQTSPAQPRIFIAHTQQTPAHVQVAV